MDNFHSDKAPSPVGAYPHAKRAGPFLFLSGVGPRSAGSNEIPGNVYEESGALSSYDFNLQCQAVFRNVKQILASSGSSWEQVVDVTVFLTDMSRDFDAFNRFWAGYFEDFSPCRTTVEILSLPTPIAIELKCIALIED